MLPLSWLAPVGYFAHEGPGEGMSLPRHEGGNIKWLATSRHRKRGFMVANEMRRVCWLFTAALFGPRPLSLNFLNISLIEFNVSYLC